MCFVLKTSHIHICDKTRGNTTNKQFKINNDNWKDGNKRKDKKSWRKKERTKEKEKEKRKKKLMRKRNKKRETILKN